MVLSLSALGEPVGSVKQWLPAITGLAGATVPQNWLICDGSTVADAASDYNGKVLPDTRGKFKRGHNSLTNANFGSDNAYKAGGTIPTGGSDANNHTHTLSGHSHNMASHTHDMSSHTHSMNSHTHGVGTYTADFQNQLGGPGVHTGGGLPNPSIAIIQSTSFSPFDHNHVVTGGNSGGPSTGSTAGPSTGNTGGPSLSNTNGPSTDATGSPTVTDNRPVFLEFVTIIKIK